MWIPDNPVNKPSLLVIGVHSKAENYPNTLFRLQFLENCGLFEYHEVCQQRNLGPFRNKKSPISKALSSLLLLWSHIVLISKYLAYRTKKHSIDIAYLPYPAIFVAIMLAALPHRIRPQRIYLDAFISLYDTVVIDRRMIKPNGLLAKLLWKAERLAYMSMDTAIVDTKENAEYISKLFELPKGQVIAIPLATNETDFCDKPTNIKTKANSNSVCEVLFIGTMIPLHGISTILDAAKILANRKDIRFKLIGDGQEAHLISDMQPLPENIHWSSDWHTSRQLAEAISTADICLGIFGNGEKTQRVCPYKIYAYASMAKCIITGSTHWSKSACNANEVDPFSLVTPNNAEELALRIATLANDAGIRAALGNRARKYYEEYLCNEISEQKLLSLLLKSCTPEAQASLAR